MATLTFGKSVDPNELPAIRSLLECRPVGIPWADTGLDFVTKTPSGRFIGGWRVEILAENFRPAETLVV